MKKIIFLIGFFIFVSCSINPIDKNKITNPKVIETKILNTNKNDIASLAKLYFELGKSREASFEINLAIKAFNKSLQEYQRLSNKTNNLHIAKCYDELGKIYEFKQEYNKALKYFQNSLKIKEQFYSSINKNIVMSYKYIGEIYLKLNNQKKALDWLEKAQKYSTYLDYNNPSPLTLDLRAKISSIYSIKRTFGKKIKLKNYILKYGKESIEVANLYRDIAKEYESKGKLKSAFNAYKNAIKIYENILLPYKKELYTTLFNLSNISKKISDNEVYLNSSIKAFESYLENRQRVFSTFDTQEQMNFSIKRKKYLYNLFDSLNLYRSNIKSVFNLWLNYKRAIFDFENNLYFLSKKDNNIESKYNQWNRKKRELAYLEQKISSHKDKSITKQISKLEQDMSYIFYKHNYKINYKDITNLLTPNQLYLDFAKAGENYYYFTLDNQANIQFKKIDKTQSKKIDAYIQRIREDGHISIKTTQKRYAKLYSIIFKDIDLTNKKSLIISPDGLLGLIPFEAFYDGEKYLIEKLKIRYIPSGKELVKLYRDKTKSQNSDMVVFADIDFNATISKAKGADIYKGLKFGKLANSKRDVMVVEKLFPNQVKLFLEDNATEKNLLKINAPEILYLSTHGFFIEDKTIFNPMLKSGIALSGANRAIDYKTGDGIVTGLELAGLNLHGTKLVVLSACETGVGDIEEAEGVASLSKAFMLAGAKNIIMTLWSVDDEKSSLLMEKFYENIKNKMTYSDALREAKLWMIGDKNSSHPYFWSGFVGSGRD